MFRQTIILISLLAVFLTGFLFAWPQYQNLREVRLKIQEKKAELQYKEEHFSNLRKISEEVKNYEPELLKINSALPQTPSLPSLFNFLSKTAVQNGLVFKNIGSFVVAPSKEKAGIKEVSLDIAVAGSYPAFKNFLSALEKTARFIEVENIGFSSPQEKELFSFNLRIKAHSY